ncbi:MAG: hypothetical protein KQH53_09420 [Desulfarculaceae bacterium]|nr:hypothetical protein [Desulfarculaceae bacterium]
MNYPSMIPLRSRRIAPQVEEVPAEVERGLSALDLGAKIKPGARIAITAGSRGVRDMVPAIAAVAAHLKALGAEPYVAPAMGSHGGGSAEGQKAMLAELGITLDTVGAPIQASMEVEELGLNRMGRPVLIGTDFTSADGVVVVNRVKPHTSFRGKVESGLCKMLTIGAGKHAGAKMAHAQFYRFGFEAVIMAIIEVILERLPLLAGVGLVENHQERTAEVRVCAPERFIESDAELLIRARELMGRVPFSDVDLLIVDEMGKNISGAGMDSNVVGRVMNQVSPEPDEIQFRRIYVRDLTDQSLGNAVGVGAADFVHQRLAAKIDSHKTRVNCLTAAVPEKGRVPFTYDRDDEAIADALNSVGLEDTAQARVVWIKNTLELERMFISPALAAEAAELGELAGEGPEQAMPFDERGNLPFGLLEP